VFLALISPFCAVSLRLVRQCFTCIHIPRVQTVATHPPIPTPTSPLARTHAHPRMLADEIALAMPSVEFNAKVQTAFRAYACTHRQMWARLDWHATARM
jgi:hypothetical protein